MSITKPISSAAGRRLAATALLVSLMSSGGCVEPPAGAATTPPVREPLTLHVFPEVEDFADGVLASRIHSIEWATGIPGDTVLIHDGEYDQTVVITGAKGSADHPIQVKAAPGADPRIRGSIVVADSHHVVIDGLTVTGSKYAGVIIKQRSSDITVRSSRIRDNGLGIWIGDGAGMGHRLLDNVVAGNETHGIAIDRINCESGRETLISGNRVFDNAHHGIEIHGNYYIIEENEVYGNGRGLPGTSGIHVFVAHPRENTGRHNIIRYNLSYQNVDKRGPDGNGIQLDQWSRQNQVYYNLVFENGGAGISLFDAADAEIYNNTLVDNMRDPDNSHPYRAELVLASDYVKKVDGVRNVTVANNVIVAVNPQASAIFVDELTADNDLSFEGNLLYHEKDGALFRWAGEEDSSIARWNQVKSKGAADFNRAPGFALEVKNPLIRYRLGTEVAAELQGEAFGRRRDLTGAAVPVGRATPGALQAPR